MPEPIADPIHVSAADLAAAEQHLRSVLDLIRWGASRLGEADAFFGHGTDNALDDAAALVLHALSLPVDLQDGYFQARLTPAERGAALALLARRVNERIPVPYLTRQAWFMGLPFYVDERVLIPRSPLAELIEQRFAPWRANADADVDAATGTDSPTALLDLCCGSGCIGIACVYALGDEPAGVEVDLVDLSADALAVAQRNVDEHGVGDRTSLIRSDLFGALAGRRYDIIVSNPPYVGAAELAALPEEYRHEPELALAADADGLACVERILSAAAEHLRPRGLLIVEVGSAEDALRAAYPDAPLQWLSFERGGDGVFLIDRETLASLDWG